MAHNKTKTWRKLLEFICGNSVCFTKVSLDVKQFKPEEITAKNLDNMIIIEARHEERQDEHGYISRHFVRRYVLPKDVDVDKCKVQISSDGVLNFSVPKKVSVYSFKDIFNFPLTAERQEYII